MNKCPCCGNMTLPENPVELRGSVCPVCYWEYEGNLDENTPSDANHGLALLQARENYRNFGACIDTMKQFVRPPFPEETENYSEENKCEFDRYLAPFFKSILEHDRSAVVVCNLNHEIIYMNPTAKERYRKHGNLVGKSILDCHNSESRKLMLKVVDWFRKDSSHNVMYTYRNEKENKDVYMVALRNESGELIGYYEKHEYRNLETMKAYDFSE